MNNDFQNIFYMMRSVRLTANEKRAMRAVIVRRTGVFILACLPQGALSVRFSLEARCRMPLRGHYRAIYFIRSRSQSMNLSVLLSHKRPTLRRWLRLIWWTVVFRRQNNLPWRGVLPQKQRYSLRRE